MGVILSMKLFYLFISKISYYEILKKYQKKQKNLIEKMEVQGMLNLEGLLLKKLKI